MAVKFNHTIVSSRDKRASATFLAGILGLPGPVQWGPFQVVRKIMTQTSILLTLSKRSPRSTTPSWSVKQSSTRYSGEYANADCDIGLTPHRRKSRRSTIPMGAGVSISKIQTVTSWRSSPVLTGAAAGTRDPGGGLGGQVVIWAVNAVICWSGAGGQRQPLCPLQAV